MTDPPKPETAEPTRTFITLETSALQRFAGTYSLPALGQVLEAKVAPACFRLSRCRRAATVASVARHVASFALG